MSSPLPPDPYVALGVPKDADLTQIKSAHRKLVLKYHPDKIKGDDVEEKSKAVDVFQRVQQAYELLSDASKRSRYDDQVKLAELQRERMMREPSRPTPQPARTAPGPTYVRTHMRSDGINYEERAPPQTSYFDDRDQFVDEMPRPSARKHEVPYDKREKPSTPKSAEKREKASSRMASEAFTMKAAMNLKAKAAEAKERVRAQEARDREVRRERSEKHSRSHTTYAAEVVSESDSDTITPKHSPPRSSRPAPRPYAEPEHIRTVRPPPPRRSGYADDEDSYDEDAKWERHHQKSMAYIAESQKRPSVSRSGSDAYFWNGDLPGGRRSGSDNEKRTSSRRTKVDESRPRPTMPAANSAPNNLRPYVVESRAPDDRVPQRAKTNPYPTDRDQRPSPNLSRSHTMPVNKSTKDSLPSRGSKLKHSETQDSGYYSSSNPHTPEMKGESPAPSRENSKKKGGSSVKYQIVNESEDEPTSYVRVLTSDDEGRLRYHKRSPEPERRDRDRDRERERERDRDREHRDRERAKERERERERERDRDRDRERDYPRERAMPIRTDSDSRTRTRAGTAAPSSFPRADSERHIPNLTRAASSNKSGRLYGEMPADDDKIPYSYKKDYGSVKTSPAYPPPTTAGYGAPRIDDYGVHMRQSRRPSVAGVH